MLQTIERYMKQAIVERNAAVSSAALASSLHLTRIANDVVKRWVNEAQEAVNSDKYVSKILVVYKNLFIQGDSKVAELLKSYLLYKILNSKINGNLWKAYLTSK